MTDGYSANSTAADLIPAAIRARLYPHTDVTQGDLAQRLGVDRTTVNRYLCGQRELTLPVIDRIALALGCSFSDLVKANDEAVA